MSEASQTVTESRSLIGAIKPYFEKESLAAFFVGVSSGFPYAMIGATLTTRLAQDGIDKKTVTAFTLAFLVYNLKVFWAWIVDGVRLPIIGGLGQRVSWLLLAGVMVIAAVINLALVDPAANIGATVTAAILVGIAGATFDIVIDAYRIETLKPYQQGEAATCAAELRATTPLKQGQALSLPRLMVSSTVTAWAAVLTESANAKTRTAALQALSARATDAIQRCGPPDVRGPNAMTLDVSAASQQLAESLLAMSTD